MSIITVGGHSMLCFCVNGAIVENLEHADVVYLWDNNGVECDKVLETQTGWYQVFTAELHSFHKSFQKGCLK